MVSGSCGMARLNIRVAFAFTGCFMGLAYLVASDDALTIFNYFVSSVTVFGEPRLLLCRLGLIYRWSDLDLHFGESCWLYARNEATRHLSRHLALQSGKICLPRHAELQLTYSAIPAILDLLCIDLHGHPRLLQRVRRVHAIRLQAVHHFVHWYPRLRHRLYWLQVLVDANEGE